MTAAKVMDTISRLPGCSGQAANAGSTYTHVKMEDASTLFLFQSQNVQTFGFVCQSTNGQNRGPVWKTQSFLSKRNLYGHLLAGLLWERQFEKVLLEHGWEKVFNWECLFVNRAKGLFLSVYVDDIKLAGKTENIEPTWKILMEDVDLGEPTSLPDHVYMVCTQRKCQISNDIVDDYRSMFESRISAGAKENYRPYLQGNLIQKQYLHGPMTWKVTQRNVWKDIANMRINRLNSYTKLQRHAWITINLKKKKLSQ